MLCARDTLVLLVRFSFLGGGDGFCKEGDATAGLGTTTDFPNPLGMVSELVIADSVVL